MPRENANEAGAGIQTLTIILDDEVAAFFEQERITDTNRYLNELLSAEMNRQKRAGIPPTKPGNQNLNTLSESTPDASGYPQMQEHFHTNSS